MKRLRQGRHGHPLAATASRIAHSVPRLAARVAVTPPAGSVKTVYRPRS
jgi:hypothetical protein